MIGFASDFDNTLFFRKEDKKYKDIDLIKIKEFQKKGHLFGICTGRGLHRLLNDSNGYVDFDFYILNSGALILNKDKDIIFQDTFNEDLIYKIIHKYKDVGTLVIHSNYQYYCFQKNKYDWKVIHSINELNSSIYGISIFCKNKEDASFYTDEINKMNEVEAFHNLETIDIVLKGNSKGKGLERIKEYYKIQYIGGIGDSFNDIPLLNSSDISFTFNNSPSLVKENSDYIVNNIKEALDKVEITYESISK